MRGRFDSRLARRYYKRAQVGKASASIGYYPFTNLFWRFNRALVIVQECEDGTVFAKQYESLEIFESKWAELLLVVDDQMPSDAEMQFIGDFLSDICEAYGIEIPEE